MATNSPLSGVLDDLAQAGESDSVTVGAVVDAFQHRSLGVTLTLFGLIASLPVIGAIPGMEILAAILIILSTIQYFFGAGTLWLPDIVRRRSMDRGHFSRGVEKARPWIEKIDSLLKPRLTAIVARREAAWTIAASSFLLAFTFFPLSLVPYGVTAPALGVVAFGLGLMACDGVMIIAGYALAATTVYLLVILL